VVIKSVAIGACEVRTSRYFSDGTAPARTARVARTMVSCSSTLKLNAQRVFGKRAYSRRSFSDAYPHVELAPRF
jgi:hypothetical protein